jgi:hypothetical protein
MIGALGYVCRRTNENMHDLLLAGFTIIKLRNFGSLLRCDKPMRKLILLTLLVFALAQQVAFHPADAQSSKPAKLTPRPSKVDDMRYATDTILQYMKAHQGMHALFVPRQTSAPNVIGVCMLPYTDPAQCDYAEGKLLSIALQIPRVSKLIPISRPIDVFKKLAELKKSGYSVDNLVLSGHGQGPPGIYFAHGVRLGEQEVFVHEREETRRANGMPALPSDCDLAKAMNEAKGAFAPGAQVYVMSCDQLKTGPPGAKFIGKLGRILLGQGGGSIIAPSSVVEVDNIPANVRHDPKDSYAKQAYKTIARGGRLANATVVNPHAPDSLFISASWSEIAIPAGSAPKLPVVCGGIPRRFVSGEYSLTVTGDLQPGTNGNAPFYQVTGSGPFGNLKGKFYARPDSSFGLVTACDGCKLTPPDKSVFTTAIGGTMPAGSETMTLKWGLFNEKWENRQLDYQVADE